MSRHSVRLQGDTDGFVAVDTLVLNGKKAPPADAYQTKLQLFTANGALRACAHLGRVVDGGAGAGRRSSRRSGCRAQHAARRARALADGLPGRRQRLVQPDVDLDGARVLERLSRGRSRAACPLRRSTGVYDWIYDGHGNWPFNTAFAATEGMEAQVARFTSINDVEDWVAAGVPVIFSWAWKKGEVTGSAVSSSDGHLAVIVGFDAAGNPIVNDPAAPDERGRAADVRPGRARDGLAAGSGGTVYLIHPRGTGRFRRSRARARASARRARGSDGRGRPRPSFPRRRRARSRAPRSPRGRGGSSARRARGS